jgi:hypothetical protein
MAGMVVRLRTTVLTVIAVLFAQFSLGRSAHPEVIRISDEALQPVTTPAVVAQQAGLVLVSFSPLVVKGQTLGEVLVYDDPTTKRPDDYFELYDSAGSLVAVGWFDQFGIQRIAVDRGLFEDGAEPKGVFVTLSDGESI